MIKLSLHRSTLLSALSLGFLSNGIATFTIYIAQLSTLTLYLNFFNLEKITKTLQHDFFSSSLDFALYFNWFARDILFDAKNYFNVRYCLFYFLVSYRSGKDYLRCSNKVRRKY